MPIYLSLAFLLFIGITRVVAQGGVAFLFAPMIASDFVAGGLGTSALGGHGVVALAFTYVWASDILTFVMAAAANGLKVATETITRNRRIVFWGMLLAIVVTLVSSVWSVIAIAYKYGGDGFFFNYVNRLPFDNAAARLQSLEGPHWINWVYTTMGAAIMGLLMLEQKRWLWWPLHPLGFPISAVFGTMFLSMLIAWVVKSAVLKYG